MDSIRRTYCSCGEWHDFDNGILRKLDWDEIPEYVDCNECPQCNPDLLDNIEDREEEAYSENVNIEDLNQNIGLDDIEDEINDEF
jgi:hypothetical protein